MFTKRIREFHGEFKISGNIYEQMLAHARETPTVETGGMLFGEIRGTGDRAYVEVQITENVPRSQSSRSAVHFRINEAFMTEALETHQSSDRVYLGNWHTHLGYGGPSGGDYRQVAKFFERNPARRLFVAVILDRSPGTEEGYEPIIEMYERDGSGFEIYRVPTTDNEPREQTPDGSSAPEYYSPFSSPLLILARLLDRLTESLSGGVRRRDGGNSPPVVDPVEDHDDLRARGGNR
jgi:proteasome lid subunit RPN8/RPN11